MICKLDLLISDQKYLSFFRDEEDESGNQNLQSDAAKLLEPTLRLRSNTKPFTAGSILFLQIDKTLANFHIIPYSVIDMLIASA
jgi:hypothetical protein